MALVCARSQVSWLDCGCSTLPFRVLPFRVLIVFPGEKVKDAVERRLIQYQTKSMFATRSEQREVDKVAVFFFHKSLPQSFFLHYKKS